MTGNIKKVVILGGGTAGWMTAAALAKVAGVKIELIESEQIGTLGVGEATIPAIRLFNNMLKLGEDEFLAETQGTIKLGIEFNHWNRQGDSYLHAFGPLGLDLGMVKFFQYWLRYKAGGGKNSLWDYSLNNTAARANRFQRIERLEGTPLPGLTYAFHFDAGLYAEHRRKYAEALGVKRTEGKVVEVLQDPEQGDVQAVMLENQNKVEGELFIDCSGFRGLLIGQTLNSEYQDWSHWLPCDRALAVPCEPAQPVLPYTRATAQAAGWQWRIPLQHRIGNGYVYCSSFISDDQAQTTLLGNLDGTPTATPRVLGFTTGMRPESWKKNVVALGLSSGFMEPLESTGIHLIQSGISRLLNLFPDQGFSQVDIDEFNRQTKFEFEHIRDFLILHYKANGRTDDDFWRHCAKMDIPDSLQQRIELFASHGRVFRDNDELFTDPGWVQLFTGQGIEPAGYHPLADTISEQQLEKFMAELKVIMQTEVGKLTTHEHFIENHCAAH